MSKQTIYYTVSFGWKVYVTYCMQLKPNLSGHGRNHGSSLGVEQLLGTMLERLMVFIDSVAWLNF